MPREPLPEELRRFLLTSVPSVPFVEALLLFRETRGSPVETALVARRLYLSEHAARAVVEELRGAGIVQPLPGTAAHRFDPHPELAGIVEVLAAHYRSHLVEVTDLIHAKSARKAHRFAEAFKWRKD